MILDLKSKRIHVMSNLLQRHLIKIFCDRLDVFSFIAAVQMTEEPRSQDPRLHSEDMGHSGIAFASGVDTC